MSARWLALLLLELLPMRTLTAADEVLLAAGHPRKTLVRVSVKDSGGTFRDLSTYPGSDFGLSASWKEDVDSNGLSADLQLRRADADVSLAPLMAESPLNRAWSPANPFAALVDLGREVKLEWALCHDLMPPDSWRVGFQGYVDAIEWADETLKVECRGLEALLMDTFIERERVYAFAQGAAALKGLFVFELARAYVLNELVCPSQGAQNGHYYKVTTAGTTSSSAEPTWPTGGASTVTSGGVTFTEAGAVSPTTGTAVETVLQQMLDDHLGASSPTLYVPTSPSWSIRWFLQERASLWEAVRKLVDQIGWDLRYKWDNGTSAWRLTLSGPDRAKTTSDRDFSAGHLVGVSQCRTSREDIRNVVRVVYSDSADLDSGGAPKRKSVESSDSGSITAYGRRWMEIAEGSSSNIDTSGEATALADAVRKDLATPILDFAPEMQLFPFVQLADLYQFAADGQRFSTAQKLAVVGYEHSVEGTWASTRLTVRGKPSAGVSRWLELANADTHLLSLLGATGFSLVSKDVVGGTALAIAEIQSKHAKNPAYELHVSTSSGFTPSSATLQALGDLKSGVIADLQPGRTYYAKAVPFGRNATRIVRGEPSPQLSFTAAYLHARHVFPYLDFRSYPLNGSFESPGTQDVAPDVWVTDTGTFGAGADWTVNNGSGAFFGTMAAEFLATSTATVIKSGWVPARENLDFRLEFRINKVGSPAAAREAYVNVIWYDYQQTVISSSSLTINLNTLTAGWQAQELWATAPADARWARISVGKSAHTDARFLVDGVRLMGPVDPWQALSYSGSWATYGSPFQTGGCMKDDQGRVFLRGVLARSGTASAGETMFTLPVGYRPASKAMFNAMQSGSWARVDISNAGVVTWETGASTSVGFLSLEGLNFDTR